MTVKQLIQALQKEDPNRLVVCSSDAEGNSYSPLYHIDRAAYLANTPWSGEVGLENLTAADRRAGYSEEDVCNGGVSALILVPTN